MLALKGKVKRMLCKVRIDSARGLARKDVMSDSDPYVVLYAFRKESVTEKQQQEPGSLPTLKNLWFCSPFLTRTIQNCNSPQWDEEASFYIPLNSRDSTYVLVAEVLDQDSSSQSPHNDDHLGVVRIPVSDIVSDRETFEQLRDYPVVSRWSITKSGKEDGVQGTLRLSIRIGKWTGHESAPAAQ